jgi:hypothetical protein
MAGSSLWPPRQLAGPFMDLAGGRGCPSGVHSGKRRGAQTIVSLRPVGRLAWHQPAAWYITYQQHVPMAVAIVQCNWHLPDGRIGFTIRVKAPSRWLAGRSSRSAASAGEGGTDGYKGFRHRAEMLPDSRPTAAGMPTWSWADFAASTQPGARPPLRTEVGSQRCASCYRFHDQRQFPV